MLRSGRLKGGKSLCKFSIANNRYYYKNDSFHDDVSFFNVTLWGPLAERAAQYLKKGKRVLVSGMLKQETYTAKDGAKREKVYVVGREVKLLDRKASAPAFSDSADGRVVDYSQGKEYAISENVIPEKTSIPF